MKKIDLWLGILCVGAILYTSIKAPRDQQEFQAAFVRGERWAIARQAEGGPSIIPQMISGLADADPKQQEACPGVLFRLWDDLSPLTKLARTRMSTTLRNPLGGWTMKVMLPIYPSREKVELAPDARIILSGPFWFGLEESDADALMHDSSARPEEGETPGQAAAPRSKFPGMFSLECATPERRLSDILTNLSDQK